MAQQQMGPEQAQELQERLSRMSPEELREYQKQNCIFCHISSGKQQAKKIYEDINCLGVLDINPANAGHVLLLPKEHYAVLPLVPDDILGHLGMVAKAISNVMLKALEAKGTTIFVANGAAAGQKAQHVMVHIIPRDEKDGLNIAIPKYRINETQLKQIKDRLAPRVKELLNYAEQKKEAEEKKEGKEPEVIAHQDKKSASAGDTTIPAMIDVKPQQLMTQEKKAIVPFERESAEEQEEPAGSKSQDAVFEEEESSSTEEKKPTRKSAARKRKKAADDEKLDSDDDTDEENNDEESKEDDDTSDSEEQAEEDTQDKPKARVDLDVIAKLFG